MPLNVEFDFLFAGKDENSFLETFTYDLYRDHGQKSGQIFANLEIQNNPVDSEYLSSIIFEALQNQFFADVDMDPYDRFELTLKVVNSVVEDYKKQKSLDYLGVINMVVAAVVENTLYLTQVGEAEAYLIRKRYVSVISEGLNDEVDESEGLFTNIATGTVEVGDFVLFSSTRLLRYISKSDLANSLQRSGVTASLGEIRDIISTEMLGRVCLTGVLIKNLVEDGGGDGVGGDYDSYGAENFDDELSEKEVYDQRSDIKGTFMKTLKGGRAKAPLFGRSLRARGGELGGVLRDKFTGFFGAGRSKNWLLLILVFVIVVLFVSIIIAKGSSQKREEIERLDKVLVSVQNRISEAETKGLYDKESAILILDRAYEDAKLVLNSGYYREKANLYLVDIEKTRDVLDNVNRIEDPLLFADLASVKPSIDALGFVNIGKDLYVYESGALIQLVLDQVQDPVMISAESYIIDATEFGSRKSIVFLTKSGELIEYKDGTVSFMNTADESFRKGIALDDWSNRIYMLDPDSNQIWKYSYRTSRNQFDGAEPYFAFDVDISGAVDFAIDASIFVLGGEEKLQRFYSGAETDFAITNPSFNDFKSPKSIISAENVNEVFVLDSGDNRVFVYSKSLTSNNIQYKSQYLFDTLSEVRDIYYDIDSKKLYILTSSAIYEVEV